jgi:hypothetical protein
VAACCWSSTSGGCRACGGSGPTGPTAVGWSPGTPAKWMLEIVSRPPGSTGFVLLKWRWIVERTIGWLNLARRLSRDYEVLPASSEAFIRLTMISIMLARLAQHA